VLLGLPALQAAGQAAAGPRARSTASYGEAWVRGRLAADSREKSKSPVRDPGGADKHTG